MFAVGGICPQSVISPYPWRRGRPVVVPLFIPWRRGRPVVVPLFIPRRRGRPVVVPLFIRWLFLLLHANDFTTHVILAIADLPPYRHFNRMKGAFADTGLIIASTFFFAVKTITLRRRRHNVHRHQHVELQKCGNA